MSSLQDHGTSRRPEPDSLQVEFLLQGGFSFKLGLRADDPLLAQVLGVLSLPASDRERKIFKIDTDQNASSVIFRASELVGIRTTPPIEILSAPVPSLESGIAPTIEHVVWSRFEDFLPAEIANRLHKLFLSERSDFRETASRTEKVLSYTGDHLAKFEDAKMELQRALHGKLPNILNAFGLELYAYEFNCEVCACSDGSYMMPTPGQYPACQGGRILEFMYLIYKDNLEFDGARTRLYDLVIDGEGRKMANLAVELPAQRNTILIFPSDFHFEVTRVRLAPRDATEVLYLLRGCLSTAP